MARKQKETEDDTVQQGEEKEVGEVFTYVGGGEDSPRVINFMGRQKFVRGKATTVADPVVLGKIRNNPSFVEGEVEEEQLHEYDEEAKNEADEQRKKDVRTQTAASKKLAKWAGRGED